MIGILVRVQKPGSHFHCEFGRLEKVEFRNSELFYIVDFEDMPFSAVLREGEVDFIPKQYLCH